MPSKLPRVTLYCPENLYQLLTKDAENNHRSESNQLVVVLEEYYANRQKAANLFIPQPLDEKTARKVPFFGNRDQPEVEQPSKLRENQDRGQS